MKIESLLFDKLTIQSRVLYRQLWFMTDAIKWYNIIKKKHIDVMNAKKP